MQTKQELMEALKSEIAESQDNNSLSENDIFGKFILDIIESAENNSSNSNFDDILTDIKDDLSYAIDQFKAALKVVKKFNP